MWVTKMTSTDPGNHCDRVVRLLGELVAIPSVNVDPAQSDTRNPEAAMVAFLERRLADFGCQIERRTVRAGRQNLLARLPGVDRSKTLMLEAHTDTVGVEGMTIDPHEPRIQGTRMTGRGTCDTKGSLAAFVEAMHRVSESGQPPPWDVLFVGPMGEETGCEGASALAKEGLVADAALVGEATGCRPMIAHKGAVWWKLSTEGTTAHGSSPHLGISAIHRMARVLDAIESDLPARLGADCDPLLGSPTINCGMIRGGEKPNVVPGRCTIELDSRILPGIDPRQHVDDVVAQLRSCAGETAGPLQVEFLGAFAGFQIAPDHPFVARCLSQSASVLGEPVEPVGGAFFSDAGPLAAAGTPCVVFGPGDIAKAHSPDEYLELDQLLKCAKITEQIIRAVGS